MAKTVYKRRHLTRGLLTVSESSRSLLCGEPGGRQVGLALAGIVAENLQLIHRLEAERESDMGF